MRLDYLKLPQFYSRSLSLVELPQQRFRAARQDLDTTEATPEETTTPGVITVSIGLLETEIILGYGA